jgi:hypothetical protein
MNEKPLEKSLRQNSDFVHFIEQEAVLGGIFMQGLLLLSILKALFLVVKFYHEYSMMKIDYVL